MTEKIYKLLKDSPAMRWTALVLLASAMFFAYMFVDILSPLQAMLQETKGWDPAAYGTYQGSETFLNVFVFFLIFAGIILDNGNRCLPQILGRIRGFHRRGYR